MAYRKHDFGDTLSEVYLQWDQSASFQSRFGCKAVDLLAVEQHFATPLGFVVQLIGLDVFRYFKPIQPNFTTFYPSECLIKTGWVFPQTFDFGSHQNNTAFKAVSDVKVVSCFAIPADSDNSFLFAVFL